jgi:hypothetical protein
MTSTESDAGFRVATLNLASLRSQAKLDALLEFLDDKGVDILLGQETWFDSETRPSIPASWRLVSAPHPSCCRPTFLRGLLVLIRVSLPRRHKWDVSVKDICTETTHEYLAVKMGPWLLASVYVPCTGTSGPQYLRLAEKLQSLRSSPEQRAIVGGDFNFGPQHDELAEAFEEVMELHPLLRPPHFTRMSGQAGTLLDNLFYPAAHPLALDYVGQPEAKTGGLLEAYLFEHPQFSDHSVVVAQLGSSPAPERPAATPPPPQKQARRVSWRHLEQLLATSDAALDNGADQERKAEKAAAEERIKGIKEKLAGAPSIDLTDLGVLRDWILKLMAAELGTWRPRLGRRNPALRQPEVQASLHQRQKAWKALSRACREQRSAEAISEKQARHKSLCREWASAVKSAQCENKRRDLDSVVDTCVQPGVATKKIFQQFSHARLRSSPREATRLLDADETAAFWREQHRATANDVRKRPPICEVSMIITTDQVKRAIKEMKRTTPGPDHMDFLVFEVFAEELAPKLAAAFTRAIREGVPEALREAITKLKPKDADSPSSQPSGYRPITLLLMVIRLFHKTLQIGFREEISKRDPERGGLFPTQAAYVPMRNGHEQVFLLQMQQALRREGTAPKRFLVVLLLDIAKAFDSLEYQVILDTLLRRKYPQEWVEIFRRILPGNRTTIMGKVIHLGRGTPQGGALSPDLCNLVLNELAHELKEALEEDQSLGDLWRKRSTTRDHRWEIEASILMRLCLTLIQFADDISILADSPRAAAKLLVVVWRWAIRHKVRISPKSLAALLATERPSDHINPMPLVAEGIRLNWNTSEVFRLLGVRCQTAHSSHLHHPIMPADKKKVGRTMAVITQAFVIDKHRSYVNPRALKMGIEQLVYTSALYESALQKVDYDTIQRTVLRRCRQTLHLPATMPSAYVMWELRLWPPHLRAHKRAMVFAAFLIHHSWIGKKILFPYLHEASSRSRPTDDVHPIFDMGPLKYISEVLRLYGVSWYTVMAEWNKPWKARSQVGTMIQRELLWPRYVQYLREKVEGTTDIPIHHRRQLLRDMDLPAPSLLSTARASPIHHHMEGDLPRAAFAFRAPYLRYQNRGAFVARASCAWCGEYEGECGYHLLRCPNLPARVATLLDKALRLIHRDVRAALGLQQPLDDYGDATVHLEEINLGRLYSLKWHGKGLWVLGRSDRGKQPDREALRACLLFMREAINAYSAVAPEVHALPVFEAPPEPTEREYAIAAQARQCYQDAQAASQGWQPSQDSLQNLGPLEDW